MRAWNAWNLQSEVLGNIFFLPAKVKHLSLTLTLPVPVSGACNNASKKTTTGLRNNILQANFAASRTHYFYKLLRMPAFQIHVECSKVCSCTPTVRTLAAPKKKRCFQVSAKKSGSCLVCQISQRRWPNYCHYFTNPYTRLARPNIRDESVFKLRIFATLCLGCPPGRENFLVKPAATVAVPARKDNRRIAATKQHTYLSVCIWL